MGGIIGALLPAIVSGGIGYFTQQNAINAQRDAQAQAAAQQQSLYSQAAAQKTPVPYTASVMRTGNNGMAGLEGLLSSLMSSSNNNMSGITLPDLSKSSQQQTSSMTPISDLMSVLTGGNFFS